MVVCRWARVRRRQVDVERSLGRLRRRRLARWARLGGAVLAVVLVTACGGTDDQGAPSALLVGPEAFASAMTEPDRVTVNVHIPDEGSIAGTDLSIPFDELDARRNELPDTSTPLAVYCRSGNMSATSVQTLAGLGFTDIVELEGGMLAWEAAGRTLLPPGSG